MDITNKKMVFLGDSITEGDGVSTPDNFYWKRFEKDGCEVHGYGIGGTRYARQMAVRLNAYIDDNYFVTRLPQMEENADIVVVFGGTNDYGHGDAALGSMEDRTDDTFYGAAHHLFTALQEKYPHATIVVMTPLHRLLENRVYNEFNVRSVGNLETYVNIIKEVAEYHKLAVLDLYHECPFNSNIESHKEQYVPDGLHPNDDGHEIIYQTLKDFLMGL